MAVALHPVAKAEDIEALFDWLEERPELPLPVRHWDMPQIDTPDWEEGHRGQAFHVWVDTQEELDELAMHLDEEAEARPRDTTARGKVVGPTGIRRRFGTAAYEVLLPAELPGSLTEPEREDETPVVIPTRSERCAGLKAMYQWLAERPQMPRPSAPIEGEQAVIFVGSARSRSQYEELVALFDRVDRPEDLPGNTRTTQVRRFFGGGVEYLLLARER
jgi:hypothetical protein